MRVLNPWFALLAALLFAQCCFAQTVRVGVVNTYSGPLSADGDQIERGISLYVKLHEKDLPPGVKLELIRRDDTGPNPEVAKRLAQELITREHVQFLTGVVWTPNALAIAPLATEAKTPFILMNSSTSIVTTKSPYIARVSLTMWQSTFPLGTWTATHGIKTAYTLVSDFAPGLDAEAAFLKSFTDSGGTIAGSVRVPLNSPDFTPFLQRAKDVKPDALFIFVPDGKQATALMKVAAGLGFREAGIKLIGPGSIVPDQELREMGDAALGTLTVHGYSASGVRPENQAFVAAYQAEYGAGEQPGYMAVAAFDGMAAIFDVVSAQNGAIDPDKTMALLKGWKHASPRGPIMIDPETRDIVQNEYLREVRDVDGVYRNVELETFPMVKDPWKIINNVK
jgi:branched-chain amino acid transport system substrate-binding protein